MSKVQFNLLPDVKLEYMKVERTRAKVITACTTAGAVSLGLFLVLFLSVNVVQKKQLSDARAQITQSSKQLGDIKNLTQALTIQNQLGTLADLHQKKHISSRLFTYLPQITPTNVNISSLTMDLTNNSMNITGTASNHQAVNTFIDTLKFTTFKIGTQEEQPAFPSVIESSFGIGNTNVTYGLNVQFDPKLFSNPALDSSGKSQAPKLSVPSLTTTRSVLQITGNPLFNSRLNTVQPVGGQQ